MTQAMTSIIVALKDLALHSSNVRAKSPETYETDNIVHLQSSIATLGLIHPLIIQKTDAGYGVLAGGRRLAALKALAVDKTAKGFTSKTEVDCRLVAEDCDIRTAISLAENITQEVMSPIDEYEAFAAMLEVENQSVETIAMTFGTTTGAVKERLRYGRVHPDIRAAVRAKALTLDAMKAFADHPSQDVQLEVYDALSQDDGMVHAHLVRSTLKKRGVQVSDDLGAFILEDYKDQGGAIASDLLEENSVIEDMELVDAVLENKLRDAAEAERARLGFAWADAATTHEWDTFQSYGRVYPGQIEVDAAGQKRLDAIADEVSALEERMEDEDISDDDYRDADRKIDMLSDEADALQTAYAPEDLAQAGVFATWNGRVQLTVGLVRPEDVKTAKTASQSDTPKDEGEITYAASLSDDLKTERAMALGAALAQNPDIAADLAMFKIVSDAALNRMPVTHGFVISASVEHRQHAKLDEIDATSQTAMETACSDLLLDWADEDASPAAQFAAFRTLEAGEKAKLVAFALAKTVRPAFARDETCDALMAQVEAEVMPNIRAYWKPNAAFFLRLKKAQLLKIISEDLGLAQEALNLVNSKKLDVVEFLALLFAEPFATLSEAQRAAVASWCPPDMQTTELKVVPIKAVKKKPKTKAKTKAA